MAIKSFAMSLVWISSGLRSTRSSTTSPRWPAPRTSKPRQDGNSRQGLALETAASIYHGAVSDQAIAGYMVDLDPHHRHRDHQRRRSGVPGGHRRRRRPVGGIQRSGSDLEGQHHPERGLDGSATAGPHRDRPPSCRRPATPTAPPSRAAAPVPASSATRPAWAGWPAPSPSPNGGRTRLGESAREAETGRTEREAMQRSQATALTRALGIQEATSAPSKDRAPRARPTAARPARNSRPSTR